jgi:hypothetical protein
MCCWVTDLSDSGHALLVGRCEHWLYKRLETVSTERLSASQRPLHAVNQLDQTFFQKKQTDGLKWRLQIL